LLLSFRSLRDAAYLIQDNRIYWIDEKDLMKLKINENNITKIASFNYYLNNLHIDWVVRNLYFIYGKPFCFYIVKFDLTMWENGIIKFDEIFKVHFVHIGINLNVSLVSMGYVYYRSPEKIIFH